MELQGRLSEIRKAGMGLAAISYDPVPTLADFSTRRGITFPLLSDPGSATIRRYGILNTTIDPKNELARKVAGAHLELTSYATDQVATLGTHFSLVLDVRPASQVHVYAPGDVTTLTITGTFEYQACDDQVCSAPQSIPLSWSIGVKPFDP